MWLQLFIFEYDAHCRGRDSFHASFRKNHNEDDAQKQKAKYRKDQKNENKARDILFQIYILPE